MENEIEEIKRVAREKKIDGLFLEITERSLLLYEPLKELDTLLCTVVFDNEIFNGLDVVVNWDTEAERIFEKQNYPDTQFFLGPRYVFLDKNFEKAAQRKERNEVRDILLTTGGVDENRLALKFIEWLPTNLSAKVSVVISDVCDYEKELKDLINKRKNEVNIEILQGRNSLFDEMVKTDIAISSAGLTSFELLTLGVPSFMVAVFEHQEKRCEHYHAKGAAICCTLAELNKGVFLENLNALLNSVDVRNKLTRNAQELFQRNNTLLEYLEGKMKT